MQLPVILLGILATSTLLYAATIRDDSTDEPADSTTVDTSTSDDMVEEMSDEATTESAPRSPDIKRYSPADMYGIIDLILISQCRRVPRDRAIQVVGSMYACLNELTRFAHKLELLTIVTTQTVPDDNSLSPFVRNVDSKEPNGLEMLLAQLKADAPQLCMNSDAVLSCWDTYLQTCYGAPAPSNTTSAADDQWLRDVSGFVDMFDTNRTKREVTTSEPETTSEETPAATNDTHPLLVVSTIDITIVQSPKNEDELRGFFGLPFLTQPEQISRLLRQGMQVLCESNNELTAAAQMPVDDLLDNIPCVVRVTQTSDSACPTDKLLQAFAQMEDEMDGSSINEYCGLLEQYLDCWTDEISRQCSRVSGDALQMLSDQYMETISAKCHPPPVAALNRTQWSTFPEFTAADNITNTNSTSLLDWIYFLLF